jgi:CTP synthase
MKQTKYLFVVGGVMSGVGKGVSAASIAKLLKARDFKVSAIKVDPYINVDAGTMNPTEHGEVFVTEDGDETDQDIGNYERFLDTTILSDNYMTTGRVYQSVIQKERNLEYQGKCVEVVPHIPQEVVRRIKHAAKIDDADVMLIEIGGTIGEYQNILFLEAARMMQLETPKDVAFVLVSYLPVPGSLGEMKTKPTQYAIRTMNASGLKPDFIIARSTHELDKVRKEKIARVASIEPKRVISAPDVKNIYDIPLNFYEEGLDAEIVKHFELPMQKAHLNDWKEFMKKVHNVEKTVKIGLVGKYFTTGEFTLSDSYLSVIEAIKHGAWENGVKPELSWINSVDFEENAGKLSLLDEYDGIVVPGGYGSRGIEGKISAIKYCRENKIPYLGLCYGMQMATVEYARHVAGLEGAHTMEINAETKHPIIHTMEDQVDKLEKAQYGGTMRLGAYDCQLTPGTLAHDAYGSINISERHRHRYEFNNTYRPMLEEAGLVFSGVNEKQDLVEIIELPKDKHPFFVGVQFHPEFKTRPNKSHPLFREFMKVAKGG